MRKIYVNGRQITSLTGLRRRAHYPQLKVRVTGVKNPTTLTMPGKDLAWYAQNMGVQFNNQQGQGISPYPCFQLGIYAYDDGRD